tara:strand:- start:1991 stop:2752 length:762 start_codon:yes stop_codon:yes gene_type:complete
MLTRRLRAAALLFSSIWAIGLGAGLAGPALGATISNSNGGSESLNLASTDRGLGLYIGSFQALNLFDPALGTLTGVSFSFTQTTTPAPVSLSVFCEATGYVNQPPCSPTVESTLTQYFSLSLGSVSLSLSTPTVVTTVSCIAPVGGVCSDNDTAANTELSASYVFSDVADIAAFVGNGQFAPSSSVFATVDGEATFSSQWDYTWDVTYTFTPVGGEPEPETPPIPELPAPGTLMLFVFGVAAIGTVRRRRLSY